MKAVVMAGGEGSRLYPLTIGRPKPMVPLVNRPVLGHILALLKHHGITEIIITLQYMPSVIQDFYGDGSSLGLDINYVVEEIPLGTAGGVKNAASHLKDTFLVISGDVLTDFDLQAIIQYHHCSAALATVTLYPVPNPLEYGMIVTDENGRITQFLEKPDWSTVLSDTVNSGIYVLEPTVLDAIPDDVPYDFSTDLFPELLQQGKALYGYVDEGYWCDVGTIEEYIQANADLMMGKVWLPQPIGKETRGSLILGTDVEIAPDAQICGPVYLGDMVKIKDNVTIHGPAVIQDYTVVDSYSRVERCILWRNTYVGATCELRGALVGRQCSIKNGAVASEGVVIGDNCMLDENSVLHPDVKLWPNKRIEPGAVIRHSIIWGNQSRRTLFGRFGVTGVVNMDFTPEFAAQLGSSLGAKLPQGSYVAINRDAHHSSRMLKFAFTSGLSSAGVNVWDLGHVPVPVARYFVRMEPSTMAGVHIRLSPFDERVIDIRIMNGEGLNQTRAAERAVERTFFREEFRRVSLDGIGRIENVTYPTERYIESFLACIDSERVHAGDFQIVVDYSHGLAGDTLSTILNRLGIDDLPLNGMIDETKLAVLRDQFRNQLQHIAKIMSVLDAGVGVKLDVSGERVFLIDQRGTVLDDLTAALLLLELALYANPGAKVALPVVVPNAFETVVKRHNGQIVFTKNDLRDLMRAAAHDVLFAADGAGHFIFPDFQRAADGLLATVRLLEYLLVRQRPVSEIVTDLPTFFMAHHRVNCPWEVKGAAMRLLNQSYQGDHVVTIDGLKIHLNVGEWVHIGLHPERPLFEIRAEAGDPERATVLVKQYGDQLQEMVALLMASDQ